MDQIGQMGSLCIAGNLVLLGKLINFPEHLPMWIFLNNDSRFPKAGNLRN